MTEINDILKRALQERESGSLDRAEQLLSELLREDPRHPVALHAMGTIYYGRGDMEGARRLLEQAVEHGPLIPGLHNALGVVRNASDDHHCAVEAFDEAIRLSPGYGEAHYNRANTLTRMGRYEEAIEGYMHACEIAPDDSFVAFNTGVALQKLDRHEEAIEHLERALRLGHDPFHTNRVLAASLQILRRYDQAITCFENALKVAPEDPATHTDLGMVLLQAGHFQSGWKHYSYRINGDRAWNEHYRDVVRWDGSGYEGRTLLVLCEQGLGDNLQFIRYLPMAKSRGGRLILAVHKPLHRLFEGFPGADEVLCIEAELQEPISIDFCCPIIDLAWIFDTSLDNMPNDVPYIHADPAKTAYWKDRLQGEELKVGIVWAGSTWHERDDHRSCGLKYFEPLSGIPGVRLYGFQKGSGVSQMENWAGKSPLVNLGEHFQDFTDTAAAMACLDLLISVDTSVLHLAGAMGKRVWGVLCYEGDWRWLIDHEDSPWYPTMRLFRQPCLGDWKSVFERVGGQLRQCAMSHTLNRRCCVPILTL